MSKAKVKIKDDKKTVVAGKTLIDESLDRQCQVVLFNDDVNPMDTVIDALKVVFGHGEQLAIKIMMEAHERGKSIAEVESRGRAQLHKNLLQNEWGLTVEVEEI
jgi:ATP-dependent Clp protease adapter protein ClpS